MIACALQNHYIVTAKESTSIIASSCPDVE